MTEVSEKVYRLYLIKCEVDNKCYVGYTDSKNEKYNPLSYLYNQFKRNENKYVSLGQSIKQNKYGKHRYDYIKSGLTKDEARDISEKLKEKLGERCLNDKPIKNYFEEELLLLENL